MEVGHTERQARVLAEVHSPGPPQKMSGQKKAVLGTSTNFWLWGEEDGFDLIHPDGHVIWVKAWDMILDLPSWQVEKRLREAGS